MAALDAVAQGRVGRHEQNAAGAEGEAEKVEHEGSLRRWDAHD